MRYSLSLSHTSDKQFLVTAVAGGQTDVPLSGCYSSDEIFLELVERANLAPDDYARLVFATMLVAADMSKESCVEGELDHEQLAILHLNLSQRNVA